jgi:hypothetical protein
VLLAEAAQARHHQIAPATIRHGHARASDPAGNDTTTDEALQCDGFSRARCGAPAATGAIGFRDSDVALGNAYGVRWAIVGAAMARVSWPLLAHAGIDAHDERGGAGRCVIDSSCVSNPQRRHFGSVPLVAVLAEKSSNRRASPARDWYH